MPTVVEKLPDQHGQSRPDPIFKAYYNAVDRLAEVNSTLLKAKMERDLLNAKIEVLESNLAAAKHTIQVLGNVEVP